MQTDIQQIPNFPEAMTWPERAKSITIADQSSYDVAAGMKLNLAAFRKKIVDEFAPMKAAAFAAHRTITAKEMEHLDPIQTAENIIKDKLRLYQNEQDRIRREAQAAIDKANREKSEAEQREREAAAKIARDAAIAEAAKIAARDEEIRLQMAMDAPEEMQASILAAPVLQIPVVAPLEAYIAPAPPVEHQIVAPTFDRAKGLGIRKTVDVRVTNIKLLCAAVADGRMPESFVEANLVALRGRARSDGSAFRVPGVESFEK